MSSRHLAQKVQRSPASSSIGLLKMCKRDAESSELEGLPTPVKQPRVDELVDLAVMDMPQKQSNLEWWQL